MEILFELAPLLLFLAYAVVAFGGNKKKRQAPPQTSRPGRSPQRPRGGDVQTAEDMLPDELWEVLTGEQRASTTSAETTPTPVAEAPVDEHDDAVSDRWRAGMQDEEAGVDEESALPPRNAWSHDTAVESATGPIHAPPEIVSLETEPLAPDARHRMFHASLTSTAAPPRRRGRKAGLHFRGLGNRSELRRAIILREVLGPPKALE